MLQRVAGLPIDDAPIDRTAHRKLDPLLIPVDIRLQKWASWQSTPRTAWPHPVLVVDEAIERLSWQLAVALRAHYLHPDLALADRLAAYAALVEQHAEPTRRPAVGRGVFTNHLDYARWSLRHALARSAT
jgi:hypothetical protein